VVKLTDQERRKVGMKGAPSLPHRLYPE